MTTKPRNPESVHIIGLTELERRGLEPEDWSIGYELDTRIQFIQTDIEFAIYHKEPQGAIDRTNYCKSLMQEYFREEYSDHIPDEYIPPKRKSLKELAQQTREHLKALEKEAR